MLTPDNTLTADDLRIIVAEQDDYLQDFSAGASWHMSTIDDDMEAPMREAQNRRNRLATVRDALDAPGSRLVVIPAGAVVVSAEDAATLAEIAETHAEHEQHPRDSSDDHKAIRRDGRRMLAILNRARVSA